MALLNSLIVLESLQQLEAYQTRIPATARIIAGLHSGTQKQGCSRKYIKTGISKEQGGAMKSRHQRRQD